MVRVPTQTRIPLDVLVIHGREPGPVMWMSAAIHGDEINGIEIIRQVVGHLDARSLCGTVLAIPVVNALGVLNHSRYLPDRRDLNRNFPGSPRGSLASRVAHAFMTQIVARCTHGIDFHSAAVPRDNLPQVRCEFANEEALRMAHAFAAPVILHAEIRQGSLRQAAERAGIPTLLYEAGEPLRFNRRAIETGVNGALRVMSELGMIEEAPAPASWNSTQLHSSNWVRAPRGGMMRLDVELGDHVVNRQRVGEISGPLGEGARSIFAPVSGMVIGIGRNPLVHQGDGILHIGHPEAGEDEDADEEQ
ncbi:MAG: succinylglutamate desuccinylase/aspartoacylase family protein [Chloroflexota bacterium]